MASVVINDTHLTEIANAIREKSGTTELLTLDEMPTAIGAIETGGGGGDGDYRIPEEGLYLTGSLNSQFTKPSWNWYIDYFGEQVITENITNATYMCNGNRELTNFKIKINGGFDVGFTYAFQNCEKLTTFAKMSGIPYGMSGMFRGCLNLRELPEGFADWFDWRETDSTSNASGVADMSFIFNSCYSLRTCPIDLFKHGNPNAAYTQSIYNTQFSGCYCLDEIVDLPNPHLNSTFSANVFANTVKNCHRLKNFTFALKKTDGSDNIVRWRNQTLDLTGAIGYAKASTFNAMLSHNSGITTNEEVYDDASYQALKNNPNWWSQNIAYSRYNHDSAVATINSLPDTSAYLASAGGTNTIKFEGASGSKTDGGAINTLTESEIAVATAKGWTVSLI